MVLFSIGAVINALAPTIEVVIAGRVLQGVAGGVFPLAFGIVRDTFPRDQVAGGLAIISAVFGIGGGIGLPLSGVIVDNLDLDWLFWISLIALPAGVRRAPVRPALAAGREHARGLARRGAALARRSPRSCSASRRPGEWGWGSPANARLRSPAGSR